MTMPSQLLRLSHMTVMLKQALGQGLSAGSELALNDCLFIMQLCLVHLVSYHILMMIVPP